MYCRRYFTGGENSQKSSCPSIYYVKQWYSRLLRMCTSGNVLSAECRTTSNSWKIWLAKKFATQNHHNIIKLNLETFNLSNGSPWCRNVSQKVSSLVMLHCAFLGELTFDVCRCLFWQDVYTYTSCRKKIHICREMKDYIHIYILYSSIIIEPQFWQNSHTGKRPSCGNSQKSAPPLFWIWYILASCLSSMSANPLFSHYPRAGTHTHTHTQTHALTHTEEVGIAVYSVFLLDDIFTCGHIRLICGCIRLQIPCSEIIHARENAQVTVENSAVMHFGNIRKGVRLLGTAW